MNYISNSSPRIRTASNIKQSELRYKHMINIFKRMSNIPYAVIKGEPLSVLAYGDVGYRNSCDIDILIPRSYCTEIERIFLEEGFIRDISISPDSSRNLSREEKIMFMNSHQLVPFIKHTGIGQDISVDINVDIFWGEYAGPRVDIKEYLKDTTTLNIYGHTVKVLSTTKSFIQVCLHHYKEMNALYCLHTTNPFTTPMFQDIYNLYKTHVYSNIDEILLFAQKHNIEYVFYYVLHYSGIVFSDTELLNVAKKFSTEIGIQKLDSYGLSEAEIKKWTIPFEQRFNNPDLPKLVSSSLTDSDKAKIKQVWSIFY